MGLLIDLEAQVVSSPSVMGVFVPVIELVLYLRAVSDQYGTWEDEEREEEVLPR